MGLEHQLFFASEPKVNDPSINSGTTDDAIYVVVNGDQVVGSIPSSDATCASR